MNVTEKSLSSLFLTTFFREHRPWVLFLVWHVFLQIFVLFLGITFLMLSTFFFSFLILALKLLEFMGCKVEFYVQECTIPGDSFSTQLVSLILWFYTQNLLILCDLYISDGWRIWEDLKGVFLVCFFFVCGWFCFVGWLVCFWFFLRILTAGCCFCLVAKMA